MNRPGKRLLLLACVVPFRALGERFEFCLVTPANDNHWEFPKRVVTIDDCHGAHALLIAEQEAGLRGQLHSDGPLAQFAFSRGQTTHNATAFLMRVQIELDDWPLAVKCKRRWCPPEEARIRIRRKPLRRLIDLALRAISDAPD